jgi:hypothetical protein
VSTRAFKNNVDIAGISILTNILASASELRISQIFGGVSHMGEGNQFSSLDFFWGSTSIAAICC